MYRKKKKIGFILLIAAAVILAVSLIFSKVKSEKSVTVYSVADLMQSGWGDSSTMTAVVKEGKTQTIKLQEGLVDEICVSEGQEINAGDLLMRYNVESYQLTLQSDKAKLEALEASLEKAKKQLQTYKNLIPSEYAPQETETVIHHTADPVETLSIVDSETSPSEEGNIYNCSTQTVVTGAFLQSLYESKGEAYFNIYVDNVLYGSWSVDGSTLENSPYAKKSNASQTDSKEEESEEKTQESSSTETEVISQSQGEESQEEQEIEEKVEFDDWTLGEGVEFNGDGTVSIDFQTAHYGSFESSVPQEAEWDEYISSGGIEDDGTENYRYSQAELTEMVNNQTKEISFLELQIKEARLTYEKDQLTAKDGQVTATISGTVTELKTVSELSSGDTLMTITGKEKCLVEIDVNEIDLQDLKVGDEFSVTGYESGSVVTAKVSEIGTEPVEGESYSTNPNSSFYPVTASVEDEDAQLRTGEYCQASLNKEEETEGSFYISDMYVRSDNGGHYVMLQGEDGLLKKKYIQTGETLWGSLLEIKSGISQTDYLAFPYGNDVLEGAKTQIGNESE